MIWIAVFLTSIPLGMTARDPPASLAGNKIPVHADTGGEAAMHLRPLSGSELRATLMGVFLTTLHPELRDGNITERFGVGGLYVRHFDRARAAGTFEIVGDSFCVRLAGAAVDTCRRLFVDGAGRFFSTDVGDAHHQMMQVEISSTRE